MTAFSVHKRRWIGNASIKSYVRKGIVMVTKTVKVIKKQGGKVDINDIVL